MSKKSPLTTQIFPSKLWKELSNTSAEAEKGGVYVKGKIKTFGCIKWKSGTTNGITGECNPDPPWWNPAYWFQPGCLKCVEKGWHWKTVCGVWDEPFIDPNQQYYKDSDCTIPKNYNFS